MNKTQQSEILKRRQTSLKEQISGNLDLLIGSVGKSPAMRSWNLTTKVGGKTVTRYVRKGHLPAVRKMTQRYKKVWALIQELSKVNWEILKLESD